MVMPNLSLSAGGGGPSSAGSNAGVSTPISNPFNFDSSGWVINFGDGNGTSASGNRDANATSQTPGGAGGMLGGLGGLLGGINPNMLLIAAALFLVLRKK